MRTGAPIPVVIVGAGPAGASAATLLGKYGVECLVLDRWDGVYPQPRAVHLDDEVFRILARVGVAEDFAAITRPTMGLQLVDRQHRVLARFDRASEKGRHGHPQANMYDQPELEVQPGSPLHAWFRDGKAAAALVRPDFTVLRTGRDVSELCEAAPKSLVGA